MSQGILITLSQEKTPDGRYLMGTYVRSKDYSASIGETGASPSSKATSRSELCNITLISYDLSPSLSTEIEAGAQRIKTEIESIFGFKYGEDFRISMRIFGNKGDFRAYKQRTTSGSLFADSAYYSSSRKEVVTWIEQTDDRFLKALYHESVHALLRNKMQTLPIWLNEGCAEYFAYEALGSITISQRNVKRKKDVAQRHLENNELAGLSALFATSRAQANTEMIYDISWCFVQFLMESPARQAVFRSVIGTLQQGLNSDGAFELHYEGGVRQLEQDWKEWLRWQ